MNSQLLSVKIVSNSKDNKPLYHTPYTDEIRVYSCVKEGNTERLFEEIQHLVPMGISVGKMSENNITQHKYMAVSCITLATRYAIQGGLDETAAYSFSDEFIRSIDSFDESTDIMENLADAVVKLTNMVKASKNEPKYSPHIRKSLKYIAKNICKKITVKEIAEHCGLTADYLSNLFKKEVGENLSAYILRQKLEKAQTLLFNGYDNKSICNELGFNSQSFFITAFKKQYEQTPNEYRLLFKRN